METPETRTEETVLKATVAEVATAEDLDEAMVAAADLHAAVAAEEVVVAEVAAEEAADRAATRRLSSGFTTPRPWNTNPYL